MSDLRRYGLGATEKATVDLIGNKDLIAIRDQVQERRREWYLLKKDKDELAHFLEKTCGTSMSPGTHILKEKLHDLTSPAGELARLILEYKIKTDKTLLPAQGASIMTSVPTAGSFTKGEWNTLFVALGLTFTSHEQFKTCLRDPHSHKRICGRNGREIPEDEVCIEYDQNVPRDKWPDVSEQLYRQLVDKSKARRSTVDAIFHWGCISHNESLNSKGAVEGWAWHEHWNILYSISMARHALDFLKPGGRLVLKFRTFEMAETLGLTALLSCAFKVSSLFANYHQTCEYIIFVGDGFLGTQNEIVEKVKLSFQRNTSYQLDEIMCDELANHDEFKSTLKDAVAVRGEMRRDHDYVTLITIQIVYHIQQCLSGASSQFPYHQIEKILEKFVSMDRVLMDKYWLPDTIQKIRMFITKHKDDAYLQHKLTAFVDQWQLSKFSITGDNTANVHHEEQHLKTRRMRCLLNELNDIDVRIGVIPHNEKGKDNHEEESRRTHLVNSCIWRKKTNANSTRRPDIQ